MRRTFVSPWKNFNTWRSAFSKHNKAPGFSRKQDGESSSARRFAFRQFEKPISRKGLGNGDQEQEKTHQRSRFATFQLT